MMALASVAGVWRADARLARMAPRRMTGARFPARALVVAGLAATTLAGDACGVSIPLSTGPIALHPEDNTMRRLGKLEYLGGLELRSSEAAFGGFSGLSVDADGRLSAVSDRGHWFTARIVRDDAGRLADLTEGAMGPLLDTQGRPVQGEWRDPEGTRARRPTAGWKVLAPLADGRLLMLTQSLRREDRPPAGWLVGAEALQFRPARKFKPPMRPCYPAATCSCSPAGSA